MTAMAVVRRDQAGAAGGLMTVQSNRFAIDLHGRMAFDDNGRAAVAFLRTGDGIAHTGHGFAIDQIVALGRDDFATMSGGITKYDDSFHR